MLHTRTGLQEIPCRAALPLLFLLTICLNSLFGYSWNRNESHIRWKTSETTHFRVHYPEEKQEIADYIMGIAEGIAEEKLRRYNTRLPSKVEFVIRSSIYQNGFALPSRNSMQIWITDWDLPLRSTHNWLKDVITHEYAHLVSIQAGMKLHESVEGAIVGFQDYFNEPVQTHLGTYVPFMYQPHWFAEGVAQYESEVSGNDSWDSHRDMIVRVATRHNQLLDYGRMGSFAGTSLEFEQGPYTQGYGLVRYLAAKHGDGTILKLWAELSRAHRQTLSGAMERVLGKSGEQVWQEWHGSLEERYSEQMKRVGPLKTGKKLTKESLYNYYPRWGKDDENLFFISNGKSPWFRSSLVMYQFADSIEEDSQRKKAISGEVRNVFDLLPNDSTFLYFSAKKRDANNERHYDLFQKNLRRKKGVLEWGDDPTEIRYTKELNAIHPHYNADHSEIVFLRESNSNFFLCVAPATGEALESEEIETLYPSEEFLKGKFGYNLYTPRFSPDGKRILFSYFDGESRHIGLIGRDGKGYQPLLERPFDDRDPDWSPDGDSFYFSSDSTGIYNIYRYRFSDSSIVAITNVEGGAFSPAISQSGKQLAYVNYDQDGFSIYHLDTILPLAGGITLLKSLPEKGSPVESIDLEAGSRPYRSYPNRYGINPIILGQEITTEDLQAADGKTDWMAGFLSNIHDPLRHHELNLSLLFSIDDGIDYFTADLDVFDPSKELDFFAGYMNRQSPLNIGLGIARRNLVSSDTTTEVTTRGTEINRQNFGIVLRDVNLSASFDLFPTSVGSYSGSSVGLIGGYSWNDFNFYELPFRFTYFKDLYSAALLTYHQPGLDQKPLMAPTGLSAYASLHGRRSSLFRGGTFRETFTFENGGLSPIFRDYAIAEADLGFTYSLAVPGIKNSALLFSGFAGSLLGWREIDGTPQTDTTLNSFFYKGLLLRGYPVLADLENLTFRGENIAQVSIDYNHPILSDIFWHKWIFMVHDLYGHAFWEAGRAWNGAPYETDLFRSEAWEISKSPTNSDGIYQSVGWGLKLNARTFHDFPFIVYFEAATALSGAPDTLGNIQDIPTIRFHFARSSFDTFATRIQFGITFGVYNGLFSASPGSGVTPSSRLGQRPRRFKSF